MVRRKRTTSGLTEDGPRVRRCLESLLEQRKAGRDVCLRGAGRWGGVRRSGVPGKACPRGGRWRRDRPKGGRRTSAGPDPRALQPAVLSSLHRRPPPRLSTCGCVTRLLVVLGSKNELPSGKPPLGDVGWSPVSEGSGPAAAKSSPTFPGRVFSSAAPLTRWLRWGMGRRPRLLALLVPLPVAWRGWGVLADGDGTDWGT